MRIRIDEFGETSISLLDSLGDIVEKINTSRKKSKEKIFAVTREFLVENRSLLSTHALEYYLHASRQDEAFPLLTQKNWIPKNILPLDRVSLRWEAQALPLISQTKSQVFPHGYAQELVACSPNIILENRFTYRLQHVKTSDDALELTCAPGTFFDYYNSCEILSYELSSKLIKAKMAGAHASAEIKPHKLGLPLRDKIDLFDFSNRSTALGVNTLCIILNKNKAGEHYYYFHNRQSQTIAEAMKTYHVIPAGTFQPDSFNDNFHERDFDLKRNILREFAEELLNKTELIDHTKDEKDFLTSKPLSKYMRFLNGPHTRFFYLGLGLDPLTTKPELLTCLVVDGSKLDKSINFNFTDNYEGEHFMVPFTPQGLDQYIHNVRSLPAGEACLRIAQTHYDTLSHVF